MRVLFDTNIILDVLLDRKEFVELSANLVSLVEKKTIKGYLCATTLTTIDYLISKAYDRNKAKIAIKGLLSIFEIASVNKETLSLAAESNFSDFEGAVQYYSGQLVSVDSIVTRNISDFKKASYPIYSPSELWGIIQINKLDN